MRTAAHNRNAVNAAREITLAQLDGSQRQGRWKGPAFEAVLLTAIFVAILTLLAVILWALTAGWERLDLNLLRNMPSGMASRLGESGMQSAIIGTFYVMVGLIVTVVPLGVSAAIYLEEFADHDTWYVRIIEINLRNLAAVPSIVFGILGLAFFYRGGLSLGSVVYTGSLTLTMLVLPTVIVTAREAIRAVPPSIRHASMGMGATKWRTIWHQVLPSSIPGIVTGTILALSRAIGEAAPLIMIGAATFVGWNPDGPFEGSFTVLPVQIFFWSAQANTDFHILAAAGVIVLLGMLLMMNSFAIWLRNRFTREW
ncbi:phosphate ABC transporter permease PstA [Nocardioides limicola]|uniref:phosphate ABC transporter permease PstA n=1 Tax=Nocardioides limicola TaxID=2803368 RepID=UPI00193B9ED0|nr:phosphate ABC transporter permease PstA [Nocardioides sp. DJM-14]